MFPPAPKYSGVIIPIQVELIAASGESITLIAIAIGEDGQITQKTILNHEMTLSFFGKKGVYFLEVAHITLKSFFSYFEKTGSYKEWEPPLSNIKIGRVSQAEHDSLEGILQVGIETFSAFSASPHYG